MTIEYPDDDITGPIEPPKPRPKPVTPTPIAAPATSHETLKFVVILAVCAVCSLGSGLMFAWMLSGSGETPSPSSALTVAAAEYMRTLPPAYHEVGLRVRSGDLKTKDALVAALKSHAKPLADAQDTAIKARINDKGEITDATGLASDLESVSVGLAKGGK